MKQMAKMIAKMTEAAKKQEDLDMSKAAKKKGDTGGSHGGDS